MANLDRETCPAEKTMTLLKMEGEGSVPKLHVMLGNGVTETYFATRTYSGTLNWHVMTPNFPRPFAPLKIWPRLDEMLAQARTENPPPPDEPLSGSLIPL